MSQDTKIARTTTVRTFATAAAVALCLVAGTVAGAPPTIKPPDVYARATIVKSELDLLRFHMGMPEITPPVITARGVALHESYFQARALFRNANQLCFEHTGQLAEAPPLTAGPIRSADVYEVVDAALQRLVLVRQTFDPEDHPHETLIESDKVPTDVFNLLVQSNRQLNLLLDRRVAPREVFAQATLATGYTACLLEPFPEFELLPPAPVYEPGKRPLDVFNRLLTCLERVRAIAERSGLPVLELTVDERQLSSVEPSDVYHLASLIVAELAYLHLHLEGAHSPPELYEVGRKVPSDVYQRVGLLETQLITLQQYVQLRSDWLQQGLEE